MSNQESKSITRELQSHAAILGGFVSLLWIIEIVDVFLFRGALNSYGVRPRSIQGLEGIIFMPFLHGSFAHLAANTLPFVTFGWLIMLRETRDFFIVSAVTILVSGFGVWLTGAPNSVHIGASGLIFGYFGFLLLRGYFERSFTSIAISLIVGFFYGGLIWGVLPSQPGVSWQAHFFGFVGGILAAQLLGRQKRAIKN
ncbi:rhomboid family intramembrane serine protease [Tychonema sp. LEGE 07199]|uniref:rhomboid family intramembrane serine protease n=1 Tax=unclassified Tychonema TaxID=2642144 RepID=UPI00187FCADB|nr:MULTISPECIES: rhomboid family intramembrane serine protease [unclassified Tychonema]MBE9122488.1 rhomboid family intramembrane serine protease [Tychonema sp. LEGE 07199]MBE9133611.1 rhomboid family intramembrane serine protease [Tychonema sp. LEGE 07196]